MTRFIFIGLFILCLSHPIKTFADTVDVWTIKLNGKVIINSNQTDILYGNHPMKINLSSLKDIDTLQIYYWTDSGLERYKWYYFLKDANNSILDKFTNQIDSLNRGIYSDRKNYISFNIQYLKQLMKSRNIKKIFVEFQQDNLTWSSSYLNKPVCIMTSD